VVLRLYPQKNLQNAHTAKVKDYIIASIEDRISLQQKRD
jgi:hypothetical protein